MIWCCAIGRVRVVPTRTPFLGFPAGSAGNTEGEHRSSKGHKGSLRAWVEPQGGDRVTTSEVWVRKLSTDRDVVP